MDRANSSGSLDGQFDEYIREQDVRNSLEYNEESKEELKYLQENKPQSVDVNEEKENISRKVAIETLS